LRHAISLPEQDESATIPATNGDRRSVSASTELICGLALLSKEAREWISSETSFRVEDLDPELSLLRELLPPLQGVESPTPSIVLALIPSSLQPLVSGWELEKLPVSPLMAIQDAIRNLRLIDLKKKQQTATLQLRTPGLETEKMISIQKEILDLQQRINDLSAPATSVPTALR
jgi:hypothetical protein